MVRRGLLKNANLELLITKYDGLVMFFFNNTNKLSVIIIFIYKDDVNISIKRPFHRFSL